MLYTTTTTIPTETVPVPPVETTPVPPVETVPVPPVETTPVPPVETVPVPPHHPTPDVHTTIEQLPFTGVDVLDVFVAALALIVIGVAILAIAEARE